MSLAQLWNTVMPVVTRTLGATTAHPDRGETITLRRPGSLTAVAKDSTPAAMELAEPAFEGDTELVLQLPGGLRLSGSLPAGARVTLGEQLFVLTEPATADGTLITVALTEIGVELPGGLLADADVGTAVEVEPDAIFQLTDVHVVKPSRRDLSNPLVEDFICFLSIPVAGQPTAPRLNDSLRLENGTVGRCASIPVTSGAKWLVQMGGG